MSPWSDVKLEFVYIFSARAQSTWGFWLPASGHAGLNLLVIPPHTESSLFSLKNRLKIGRLWFTSLLHLLSTLKRICRAPVFHIAQKTEVARMAFIQLSYCSRKQDLDLTPGCLKAEESQISSSLFQFGPEPLAVQRKHLTPQHLPEQKPKASSPHSLTESPAHKLATSPHQKAEYPTQRGTTPVSAESPPHLKEAAALL